MDFSHIKQPTHGVKQVFQEVEYIGKYIAETKASCQWVLSIADDRQDKVSFTVQDSTLSGKKEILRNGTLIYSQIISSHPKELLYKDEVYNLTLDYFTYYNQHIIHIQVLQKKGVIHRFCPREFRLFVDGVNFNALPTYFNQHLPSHLDSVMATSYSQSISFERPFSPVATSLDRSEERGSPSFRKEEDCRVSRSSEARLKHPRSSSPWIIGRNY